MEQDEIIVPILKAINDLRDDVRENRQEIKEIKVELKNIRTENEERWNKHEEETRRQRAEDKKEIEKMRAEDKAEWMKIREQDRKEDEERANRNVEQITNILYSFQSSVENMYMDNRRRIERLEKKLKIAN